MDALTDENRFELNPDLESWTESAVRHSMAVAHMCSDAYRDLIIKTCGRVSLLDIYYMWVPGLREIGPLFTLAGRESIYQGSTPKNTCILCHVHYIKNYNNWTIDFI